MSVKQLSLLDAILEQPQILVQMDRRRRLAALSQLLIVAGPILSAFAELSDEAPVTKADLKDELMTVKEVAERMQVNFRTVYTRLKSGAYPGLVRDGRMMRVSRLAFEKWLKNRAAA